ncbi:ribosomal protein l7ae family member [Holotrichia oblita]|uniref:Ribosomal protein l7ae family member n=1 Tax=Holotrichia oblita TaxID=644536 RepID=A0ACB9SQU7_HOLOL|nr:ribosomal protein l7ae family member [Holotrichia oblita]
MGKVKKVQGDITKIKKAGNKSLSTIKKSKIIRNQNKIGASVLLPKKTNKFNDSNSSLTKPVKESKTNQLKQGKSKKIKSKPIISIKKPTKVSMIDSSLNGKKAIRNRRNKSSDHEIINVDTSPDKKKTLNKSKELAIKKTTSFKSKTEKFKVKTALIFNQKPSKIENGDEPVLNIQEDTVRSGIKAIFKAIEENKTGKNLFEDDEIPIFLHFSTIKIPKTPARTLRIPLKHTLLKESSDVCLIVEDMRGHRKKEFEKTIEHYENILRENGVTNIKTIMTLYQLKTEYNEFELKRKLVELYDMFLMDGKIGGYVVKKLGKIFMEKRKLPIPVRLDATSLKEHINFALRKTSTNFHSHGDNFSIQIAHSDMTEDEIYENFEEACTNLAKSLPGGWENIRGLNLKAPKIVAIPVYYSLKNPSDIKTPVAKFKRSKTVKTVTGELSTAYDREVKVLPSGEVKFKAGQVKTKTKSRKNKSGDRNGVGTEHEAAESDEEFERLHKQLENASKKVKGPVGQVKGKISKKQSLKLKAKQNRNLKNKGPKKVQRISNSDNVKSIRNNNKGKKHIKKNKLKIHK